MKLTFNAKWIGIILITVSGFAVYTNSLTGKFIWDDQILIENNTYIRNWSKLPSAFTEHIGAGAGKQDNFYRPLQTLSYLVDYSFWRLNPVGYHLSNIIWHILAALAIFWFVNILSDNRFISLFTSLLFVIHPIHTEAVSYISGRSDLMALLFMLLCFIFYLKNLLHNRMNFFILATLSYILALLSRESSLILPFLPLLYHYFFKRQINFKQFTPIMSVAVFYSILRFTVLDFSSAYEYSMHSTLLKRMPGFFVALCRYLKLLVLPFPLHMEYGKKLFNLANPQVISGILILAVAIIYLIQKRHSNRLILFSIGWFFLALLPVSNIYPLNAFMAEHWLYTPSVGFFLILAIILHSAYNKRQTKVLAVIILSSLVVYYSWLTIKQNNYWREPINFYRQTLKYAPDSAKINTQLGTIYHNKFGNSEKGIALLKRAIELKPDYADAYNNLGFIYSESGRSEEAIELFRKAIELKPDYADAYNNLGVAFRALNRNDEASNFFKEAIELKPDYADAYNNLGVAYRNLGKNEEAIIYLKKAVKLSPGNARAYSNLGIAYYSLGRNRDAIILIEKAIEINPNYVESYNNLGVVYYSVGRKEDAIAMIKKALEIDPDYANARNNYNLMKQKKEQ